jgi:hypothetical protein
MNVPDAWSERFPVLDVLEEEWQPVPKLALAAWLVFYALFLWQAARGRGLLLMIDLVFIPVHEGGHLLFRWFGEWLHIAGGTLMQLFVPFALAVYFAFRRQAQGTAFCAFFFFEQFLPVATYMADARAQELPLLTAGNAEYVEHDWYAMFSRLGVLEHDTSIAGFVRMLGWLGMFATAAWLAWRGLQANVAPQMNTHGQS